MHALILATGSLGDMHPFIGIGRSLARRGHRVTVCSNEVYRQTIEREGFTFVQTGSRADYDRLANDAYVWDPRRSLSVTWRGLAPRLMPTFRQIEPLIDRDTVLVASSLSSIVGRLLQDRLGSPLVTVSLAAATLLSARLPSVTSVLSIPHGAPYFMRRGMLWALSRGVLDQIIGPELNRCRAELDLPPVKHVLRDWTHSPQRVLGLFPSWFAPPQSDWPGNMRLTGFPLFDDAPEQSIDAELEEFLAAGAPPVVFTPGSAMLHGRVFFARALDALVASGERGIFLTRQAQDLPALPASVLHVPYTSLRDLLPRAAAVVHHGGIGTMAQAFRAGIPQLITPFAFDQHDNAARLQRLGCGLQLKPTEQLDMVLRQLLADRSIRDNCTRLREQLPATSDASDTAAEEIEATHREYALHDPAPALAGMQSKTIPAATAASIA